MKTTISVYNHDTGIYNALDMGTGEDECWTLHVDGHVSVWRIEHRVDETLITIRRNKA